MSHPAEVPIREILAAIPERAHITGLWVQNPTDGTNPYQQPVHVSVQWSYGGGYASCQGGDGPTVGTAASDLLRRMRDDR